MLTINPAYGRDYKTAKAARADWHAGKDFRINDMFHVDDGRYINKADADRAGTKCLIRFCSQRKTCTV